MKALIYEGPEQLRFGDSPAPESSGDDLLISVAASGICGSDMHAFFGHDPRRPPPLILGHEASGETGGRKVVINPLVVCNECRYCKSGRENLCQRREIISMPPRQGAFAEQVVMPERNVLELPPNLSLEQGALTEPMACGHHAAALALQHSQTPAPECQAAVLGGGAIGLASALSLSARGVKQISIVETNSLRHPTLKEAGDFAVLMPDKLESVDIIIDAVGSAKSRKQAFAKIRPGGVISHIGLADGEGGSDMRRATLQEITVCGAYTYTPKDFAETLNWMSEKRLGSLDWFQTRPLQEGGRAFADLTQNKTPVAKIILIP